MASSLKHGGLVIYTKKRVAFEPFLWLLDVKFVAECLIILHMHIC